MNESAFDHEALVYDSNFTHTGIGKMQRKQVWKLVDCIDINQSSFILEINCGTGEDASYWGKRSKNYLGTDVSSEMIAIARKKNPSLNFEVRDFKDMQSVKGQFDIIFSNFGGLNCVNHHSLNHIIENLSGKLAPGGRIICVIMGKKCIWDNLFLLLKGKTKDLGRRNTNESLKVHVKNVDVETWYYDPRQLKKINHMRATKIKPIGLFVPPSYLASYFEKRPRLLKLLNALDSLFRFSFLANYADHFYIELEKK